MLSEGENPELVNNGLYSRLCMGNAPYSMKLQRVKVQVESKEPMWYKAILKKVEAEVHIKTATDIDTVLAKKEQYTQGYQMQFTSNHDENFGLILNLPDWVKAIKLCCIGSYYGRNSSDLYRTRVCNG